jgi:hypothetical protein
MTNFEIENDNILTHGFTHPLAQKVIGMQNSKEQRHIVQMNQFRTDRSLFAMEGPTPPPQMVQKPDAFGEGESTNRSL